MEKVETVIEWGIRLPSGRVLRMNSEARALANYEGGVVVYKEVPVEWKIDRRTS